MKLSSILSLEASEEVGIYLHREGLFLKAYERSAFLLLRETGKKYQVKCRQMKATRDVVRLVEISDPLQENFSTMRNLRTYSWKNFCKECVRS